MASVAVGTTADTPAATSAVTASPPPVPLPRNLSAQNPETAPSSDTAQSSTSSSAMASVQTPAAALSSPPGPPQPPPVSSPPPPPASSSPPPPPPPPPVDLGSVASPPPPDLPPPPDFYSLSSSPPPPPPPPSYLFPELLSEDLPPPPPAHLMMDLPPPPPPMYICSYDPPSPEVKSEYDPQLPPQFAAAAKQQQFPQAPPPAPPPPPRTGPPPRPSPPPPPTPPVRQASKENLAATTHTDTPAAEALAVTSEIATSAGSPESSCEASGEESKTRGETSTAYPGKNVTEDSADGRPASSLVSSSTLTATMLLTPESGLSPLPPHALRVSPVPTSSSLEFTDDFTMTPPSSDVTFASNFYDNSKDSTIDMETPEVTPQLSEIVGSVSSTPIDLTLSLVPDSMDTSTHISETSHDVLSATVTSDDALSPLPKSTSEDISQGNEDDDSLSARNDVITERSDLDTLVFPSTANTSTTEMAQMSSPFSTEPPSLFSLPTDSDTISAEFDSLAADTLSPTGDFDSLALEADTCSVTTFTTAVTTDAYMLSSSSPGVSDTAYATADSTMASATASPAFTESCTITPVPNDYLTPLSTNPTTTPIPSPIPTEAFTSRPSSLSPFLDSKSSTPHLSESSLVTSEGTASSGSQYPVCPSSFSPSPHSSTFAVSSARTMASSQHRPDHKVTNAERLVASQSSESHMKSTSTQGSSVMSQVSENEKGGENKDYQPINLTGQGESTAGSGEKACKAGSGQGDEKQDCPDVKNSESDGASETKECKTQEQSTEEESNVHKETESRTEEEINKNGQEKSECEEKEVNKCIQSKDTPTNSDTSAQSDSSSKEDEVKLDHEDVDEKKKEVSNELKGQPNTELENNTSKQNFEKSKSEEAQKTKSTEDDDNIQNPDDKENIEVKSDEHADLNDSKGNEEQTMENEEKANQEITASGPNMTDKEKSGEEREISQQLIKGSSEDKTDAEEDNAKPDCEVASTTVAENSGKQLTSNNDQTDKINSERGANSSKDTTQTCLVIPTITGSVSDVFQGSEGAPFGTPPKSPNSRRRRQPLASFPHSRSPTPSHGVQLEVSSLSAQSKISPTSPHSETNTEGTIAPGRTPSPVTARSCQADSSRKSPSPKILSAKSDNALLLLNATVGNLETLSADLPASTSIQQDTHQTSEKLSLSPSNESDKTLEEAGALNAKETVNEEKKNLTENGKSQEEDSEPKHQKQNGRKDSDSSHTADVLNNNTNEDVKTQLDGKPVQEKQVENGGPQVSEQPLITNGVKIPESSFVEPLPQSESTQPSALVESVSQSSTLPSPIGSVKSDDCQTNDVTLNVCSVQNATPASITLPESSIQHTTGTGLKTSIIADQGESKIHGFDIDERKDNNGENVEPECSHADSIPIVSSDKQVFPESSHENKLEGQVSVLGSSSVSASHTPTNGSHTLLSSSSPLHSILEDVVEPPPVPHAKTPPPPPPRSCVNTPKPGMSAPLPPPRQYMLIPINPPQTTLRRHSPPPAPPRSTSIRKSPPPPPPRSAIHTPASKNEWIDFPPLPPPPISSLNTPSSPTPKLTPVPEETSSPSTPQPSASSRNSDTCSPVTSSATARATTPSLSECEADSRISNKEEQTNAQAITISSTYSSSQLDVKTDDKPPALPPPPEEESEEEPPLPPPPPVDSQSKSEPPLPPPPPNESVSVPLIPPLLPPPPPPPPPPRNIITTPPLPPPPKIVSNGEYLTSLVDNDKKFSNQVSIFTSDSAESSKEPPTMPPPPPAQPATEALAVSSSSMLTSNVTPPVSSVPPVPPPAPSSTSSDDKSQYTPPPPPPNICLTSPKPGLPNSSLFSISPYGKVVINRSDLPLPSPEEEIRKVFVNVKDWGILEEETETLSVYTQLRPNIQQGPQCGLVALSMASQVFPETVDVADLLKEARRRGFTKHGEMFSSEAMVSLAEGITGMEATIRRDVLCDPRTLLELLMKGDLILVPYDAERNHLPGLRGGHKAHWGIICGCLVQCPTLNVHMGGSSKLDSHVDHLWHFRPRLRKGAPGMSRDGSVTPSGTPLIPGSPRLGHRPLRTPDISNEFKYTESHEREGSCARSVDMESWSVSSSRVTTPMLPELPHEEFKLIPLWRQGKGRNLMAAPLEKLCESNDQLLSYPEGTTEAEMEYVIGSVQDGLAGQVVVLHKTKTALSDLVGMLQEKK